MFERIQTAIPEVCLLRPTLFPDRRGYLFESYHAARFAELGIVARFVQDNQSRSSRHTLRGLHYQLRHPQAKLCRVLRGEVFDVAVDLRRGSPTFCRHVGARLSAENLLQMYIPPGFAHGFVVLSDDADVLYKCSDFYDPDDEYGILWSDPQLNIAWGVDAPVVSEKDSRQPLLTGVDEHSLPRYAGG